MRWWKWIGLAGVVGVAATGVVVARAERRRRAYTPDEVRVRLHARLDEASAADAVDAGDGGRRGPRAALRALRLLPRQRSGSDVT